MFFLLKYKLHPEPSSFNFFFSYGMAVNHFKSNAGEVYTCFRQISIRFLRSDAKPFPLTRTRDRDGADLLDDFFRHPAIFRFFVFRFVDQHALLRLFGGSVEFLSSRKKSAPMQMKTPGENSTAVRLRKLCRIQGVRQRGEEN